MVRRRFVLGTFVAAAGAAPLGAWAQGTSADPATSPGLRNEPAIERLVVEDDRTRIEELRVRGQTQRLVVRPKGERGAAYEIVVRPGARDLSDGPGANRGAGGQRVWSVMNF
jgi:hypothetical protein